MEIPVALLRIDCEQPLFFLSVEQNARDTQMTTRMPSFRASRVFAPPACVHCSH